MKFRRLFAPIVSAMALAAVSQPASAQREQPEEKGEVLSDSAPLSDEEVFEFQSAEEEAMEEFEREIADAFSIFGAMFEADPLTPEQEALLPLATRMTEKVFPEGSFAVIMEESMGPMMSAMMSAVAGDTRAELSLLTGITSDELSELDDAAVEEAMNVLDPHLATRNERAGEVVIKMMGDMFEAIEPSYREALARAFTTRFDEAEMTELLAFFETPVGGKFAQQSILVQYDPQMMTMMEQMGPAMAEAFPAMMEGMIELAAEFPEARVFTELSAAERGRLAQLLGKGEAELEALSPEREELEEDTEDGVI